MKITSWNVVGEKDIHVDIAPTNIRLTASKTSVLVNEPVTFIVQGNNVATVSYNVSKNGTIVISSTKVNKTTFSLRFNSPGTYLVTASGYDSKGNYVGTDKILISVLQESPVKKIRLVASKTSVQVGEPVTFTVQGNNVTSSWYHVNKDNKTVINSTKVEGNEFTITFNSPGTYTIVASGYDSKGNYIGTDQLTITVTQKTGRISTIRIGKLEYAIIGFFLLILSLFAIHKHRR